MTYILLFAGGIVALMLGATAMVRGASRLALSLGLSPLVVGLTIVALGTSSPEIAVSVGAAVRGTPDLAVGNVIGSNIFNILFILGIAAIIAPLTVHIQLIRQEVPIMIGASVLLVILSLNGVISRLDGTILLALLIVYVAFLVVQSRKESRQAQQKFAEELRVYTEWDAHWLVQLLLVSGGLGMLVLGSGWLVTASVVFARALGVSEVVIGLTIVAAGTSVPEVATSIVAALKGERDIAVGNAVGSNTFNILGCLGLSGMVAGNGIPVASSVLNFDIWVMLAVALACVPVFVTGRRISRWEGSVFMGYYVAYTAYLVLKAQEHEALERYSQVMLAFVLPLTVVTLLVVMIRDRRRASVGSAAGSAPT